MNISIEDLCKLIDARLEQSDPTFAITGFASLADACQGDVSFLGNEKYTPQLKTTRASAVILAPGVPCERKDLGLLRCENPSLAFGKVVATFGYHPPPFQPGIHPTAIIANSAKFDPGSVAIGPYVVIEDAVVLGPGTEIMAGSYIGRESVLGESCRVFPNVTIRERCRIANRVIIHSGSVIGGDGFGYQLVDGRHQKIDQVGIVQIDDDVEIGACTTIDRARFGRTWIGEGCKIDNLVQIAHNVVIGKHSVIVAQTGIAGSTRVGEYVTLAAQVGVAGHIEVADNTIAGGKSGIASAVKIPGQTLMGYPTKPIDEWKREIVYLKRLPKINDKILELETRLKRLEQEDAPQDNAS